MSCYHPLVGLWKGDYTENGKKKYEIQGNLDPRDCPSLYDKIVIPCGHCIGCRLDYSRSWADRMMLELETSGCGVFLTLTYDNNHLPISDYEKLDVPENFYLPYSPLERWSGGEVYFPATDPYIVKGKVVQAPRCTLVKRDVQLFMKRLRREFDGSRGLPYKKIRFYAAGEYGCNTHRSHYHCILFGLSVSDFNDLKPHGKNELGQLFYSSDRLAGIWSNGFCLISDVSWKTCAYVARYVTKKLSGDLSLDYAVRNCIPEFALMSRKPGIGREYLDRNPDCLDYQNINLSAPDGAIQIRIPKYYLKQLNVEFITDVDGKKVKNLLYDPDRYDKIMEQRKSLAEDRMLLKLQNTELGYLEYLEVEEQKKLECVKSLKRE